MPLSTKPLKISKLIKLKVTWSSLLWLSVNKPDEYPWGYGFDLWPRSVGWGSCFAASCVLGLGWGSDLALLWLWCRPAAAAPIRPLTWESYPSGASLKRQKKKLSWEFPQWYSRLRIWHCYICGSDSIPGPETSIVHRCGWKKGKKKNLKIKIKIILLWTRSKPNTTVRIL